MNVKQGVVLQQLIAKELIVADALADAYLLPGMEVVASFDGAGRQLKAVTCEDFLSECALQWIQMIKSNPNATAVEQPWDVSVCYKLLHAWAKLSRKGVSQPADTIKARVKEALGDPTIRGKLVLGVDRQDALIDLCGKLPQMLQQALTPQYIRAGFMRSCDQVRRKDLV